MSVSQLFDGSYPCLIVKESRSQLKLRRVKAMRLIIIKLRVANLMFLAYKKIKSVLPDAMVRK